MPNNNSLYVDRTSITNKFLYAICLVPLVFALIHLYGEANTLTFDIFSRLQRGAYYLEASRVGPLALLSGVAVACIVVMLFLMIFDKLKKNLGTFLGKISVVVVLAGIGFTIIWWPVINHKLDKHNYHYCFFYSGSNIASPPVYVKNPSHCIATPRQNIDEILAWFDAQEAAGVRLTAHDVQQKVDELKAISGY